MKPVYASDDASTGSVAISSDQSSDKETYKLKSYKRKLLSECKRAHKGTSDANKLRAES